MEEPIFACVFLPSRSNYANIKGLEDQRVYEDAVDGGGSPRGVFVEGSHFALKALSTYN